jgi:hypothetical protein
MIAAFILAPLSFVTLLWVLARTPYFTGEGDPKEQPVKFDHRHHVRDDGIDCLYCHYAARTSPHAGVPAASLCMNCHSQIWTSSPELSAVRSSYFANTAIRWERVNSVPDFVFFNHSIHVAKGVGCVTCHGRVDEMAVVYQAERLSMSFCLDCHRDPERFLRPPEAITAMSWTPARPQAEIGRELKEQLAVHPTTDCTGCHR